VIQAADSFKTSSCTHKTAYLKLHISHPSQFYPHFFHSFRFLSLKTFLPSAFVYDLHFAPAAPQLSPCLTKSDRFTRHCNLTQLSVRINVTLWCVRVTIVLWISNTYIYIYVYIYMCVCVCVCVLLIQHATGVRRIVLPSVVCPSVPHFSTMSHKRYDLRESVIQHKMCFDFLCNFRLKCFSLCEEFSEMLSQLSTGLHVRYPY
jgi:hypothetical protein